MAGRALRAVEEGRRSFCHAYLSQILQALKEYEIDHGQYPPISVGLSALSKPRAFSDGRKGPEYMDFRPGNEGVPRDVWGNPLVYRVKGTSPGLRSIELYSVGPNGVDEGGKGDDVNAGE